MDPQAGPGRGWQDNHPGYKLKLSQLVTTIPTVALQRGDSDLQKRQVQRMGCGPAWTRSGRSGGITTPGPRVWI